MQLIFGREVAQQLREKYTVLELETIDVEGKPLDVFCVIPAEKIAFADVSEVAHQIKLHDTFVSGVKAKDYKLCSDLYIHVLGKFGGEVDSFYEEMLKKFALEQESSNT